jgi:hypothetical protein
MTLVSNSVFVLNLQKKADEKEEMTCTFAVKNGTEVCDLSQRKKVSLEDIKTNYPAQYKSAKSHHFQKIYRSNYINAKVNNYTSRTEGCVLDNGK